MRDGCLGCVLVGLIYLVGIVLNIAWIAGLAYLIVHVLFHWA